MANLLIKMGCESDLSHKQNGTLQPSYAALINENCHGYVYGNNATYNIFKGKEGLVIAIGYVSMVNGGSIQETLSWILDSFQESQIGILKKTLIGQFVLLVKKNGNTFIFSDFWGVRNIFYCMDTLAVSSSYALLEELIRARVDDLDRFKLYEYIAMGHSIYPTWLGTSTYHKRINWLRPNEYIVFDTGKPDFRINQISYSLDNNKESDVSILSDRLVSALKKIITRKEFKDQSVVSTLTGGHDSRLISALSSKEFPNLHFRIAVSYENANTLKDLKIARKLAKLQEVPLDIYRFRPEHDASMFFKQTEGFSPVYNNNMTPLIEAAAAYSLGIGGWLGTELFMPIRWETIEEFIDEKISASRQALDVEHEFWKIYRDSMIKDFNDIKKHYKLKIYDERDYIRLFYLIATARYGSFVMSAYNLSGFQLDPYANYSILELALKISSGLWGDHRKLGGTCLVQKHAMAKVNQKVGRFLTFGHYRPMLPLSFNTLPNYLAGSIRQYLRYIILRILPSKRNIVKKVELPGGGHYLTNGWETPFLERTIKKYGYDS